MGRFLVGWGDGSPAPAEEARTSQVCSIFRQRRLPSNSQRCSRPSLAHSITSTTTFRRPLPAPTLVEDLPPRESKSDVRPNLAPRSSNGSTTWPTTSHCLEKVYQSPCR